MAVPMASEIQVCLECHDFPACGCLRLRYAPQVLLAGVKELVLCHSLLTACHAPQVPMNVQVMEVEAFCGVHDMIHAAILSYGSQASLREVMAALRAPLNVIRHPPHALGTLHVPLRPPWLQSHRLLVGTLRCVSVAACL